MPKTVYTWTKVKAGDIISFRYKGKKATGTLTTLLVLNPKIPYDRKDGTKTFHLVGLKLEEQGTIPLVRNKPLLVQLLSSIGEIQVVDGESGIFRVEMKSVGPRGVTKRVYKTIKRKLKQFAIYRTYDYKEARKSQVFLEPITLPKLLVEALLEN